MKILVTFASEHGSTAEIAERLAARLRARGVDAEATEVEDAPPLKGFDAIVVGSAIHDGAWLPSAATYMTRNARALAARPTWMFSVGMVDALPRVFRKLAKAEGRKVVAPFLATTHPRGVQLFSGVIREAHLSRRGRALFRMLGCRFGDYRDWAAIEAWADAVVDELTATHAAA